MRMLLVLACAAIVMADVRLPPKITLQPESLIYEYGSENVEMHCEAEGIPEVEYSWKKDEKDFNLNDDNINVIPGTGSFVFKAVGRGDAGYYQCFANNQYGLAMSHIGSLQEAMLGSFPVLDDPVEYDVAVGKHLKLLCNAPESFPTPIYSWAIAQSIGDTNPTDVVPSKRVTIALDGSLNFANVQEGDQMGDKIYMCKAYNPYLRTTKEGSESKIIVAAGDVSQSTPAIKFKPGETEIVVAGRTVSFQCLFSGYPTPEVKFTKVGEGALTGRKTSHNFGTEMKITDVEEGDAGTYKCTGRNTNGESFYEFDIKVDVIPVFEKESDKPHDMNKTVGDSASFKCVTKGKPEAEIHWFKNGKAINSDDPGPKMSVTEDRQMLTIIDLCKTCSNGGSDLMVIQCNASNEHGYAFADGYLNILLRTKIVKKPKDINLADWKDEVFFPCEAEGDASTPVVVKWYFEGSEIDPNNEGYEILDNGLKVDAVLLDNQKKGKAEGKYKCEAKNGGWSEDSAEAYLTLPGEDAPIINEASFNWVLIVIILVVLILLILLIVLVCCLCKQRNMRDEYPVDEKERKAGLDPEKELVDTGFHGYERPEARGFKGSQASLVSRHSEDDDSAFLTLPKGAEAYA